MFGVKELDRSVPGSAPAESTNEGLVHWAKAENKNVRDRGGSVDQKIDQVLKQNERDPWSKVGSQARSMALDLANYGPYGLTLKTSSVAFSAYALGAAGYSTEKTFFADRDPAVADAQIQALHSAFPAKFGKGTIERLHNQSTTFNHEQALLGGAEATLSAGFGYAGGRSLQTVLSRADNAKVVGSAAKVIFKDNVANGMASLVKGYPKIAGYAGLALITTIGAINGARQFYNAYIGGQKDNELQATIREISPNYAGFKK